MLETGSVWQVADELQNRVTAASGAWRRFIATNQNIDTEESNLASRFLLHMLTATAEFERELIRERAMAGLQRYRHDYGTGKVGKETRSRSGKNLPVGRPRRVFDRERVLELRFQGTSPRQIARTMGLGEGTARRVLQASIGAMGARQNPAAGII